LVKRKPQKPPHHGLLLRFLFVKKRTSLWLRATGLLLSKLISTGTNRASLLLFFFLGKAVAAVYRSVFARAERHLSFGVAGCTNSREHFALGSCAAFALIPATFTALGFVYETSFGVKLLFTGSEDERSFTFLAS